MLWLTKLIVVALVLLVGVYGSHGSRPERRYETDLEVFIFGSSFLIA